MENYGQIQLSSQNSVHEDSKNLDSGIKIVVKSHFFKFSLHEFDLTVTKGTSQVEPEESYFHSVLTQHRA